MPAIDQSVPFKLCPICRDLWWAAPDFLADALVAFWGYQPFLDWGPGLLLFNHVRCGTTLPMPAADFAQLTPEPVLRMSCAARGVQEEYCLARKENRICPPTCACRYVAEVTRLVAAWPKDRLT